MKMLFIDCETTGTDPARHGLVQMAGAAFVDKTLVESFNLQIAPFPSDEISDESLVINGLTREVIARGMPPQEGYTQFVRMLARYVDRYDRTDKFHFIGYNADFDSDFVRMWFEKNDDIYFGSWFWWPVLDVAKLAGIRLMSARPNLHDFKLMTVAQHLDIDLSDITPHEALNDIKVTMRIFKRLTQDIPLLLRFKGQETA